MRFLISPHKMRVVYEMLKTFPPYNSWRLPPSRQIKFIHIGHRDFYGDYHKNKDKHIIRTTQRIKSLPLLIETIAHEMVHLKQEQEGKLVGDGTEHGSIFQRLAKEVCKNLKFDYKEF